MADWNQKCAKIIKLFSPQCPDIPNVVTKVEWRKVPIVNVIISCVHAVVSSGYTEWLECSAVK